MKNRLKKISKKEAKGIVSDKEVLKTVSEQDVILKLSHDTFSQKKEDPFVNFEITLQECNRKGFFMHD
jgi:hypothetical protein